MASGIRFTIDNHVAAITLASPPLNILTASVMEAMSQALSEAAADASVKALVVRAEGRAFSAGADVEEHRPEKVASMIGTFGRLFRLLDSCEIPIVAAVAGPALGAGFELAMMADVLLASERAVFGQPEIRLGFFAPAAVVRLPALAGPAKAMEITASGRTYSASEMASCGIVTRVVAEAELENAVESTCDDFRRSSPLVLRMNARVLKSSRGLPFADALGRAETVFMEELMRTEDVREGVASFFEKRTPVWRNR